MNNTSSHFYFQCFIIYNLWNIALLPAQSYSKIHTCKYLMTQTS